MNANQWRDKTRAAAAEDVTLPSGMTIKAMRISPLRLAQDDRLPLSLATLLSPGAAAAESDEQILARMIFLRDLLVEHVISPRVTLDAKPDDPDALHPSEISNADLVFLWAWFMRADEVATLRRFRERGQPAAGGADGAGVSSTPFGGPWDNGTDCRPLVEPGGSDPIAASASGSDGGDAA